MAEWIYLQNNKTQPAECPDGIPASIVSMLRERGVEGECAIRDFLAEHPRTTHDPFLLPDLAESVDEILKAIDDGRKICVYGDYDADGVTSCSLLLSVLSRLTDRLCYHIPSRFIEGYGLNNRAIQQIADEGTSLIITVDCGSTSPDEVCFARSLGVDIIITDHHSPYVSKTPDCLFVNPKRADSKYPFTGLSGCGVAFKLAQGIQRTLEARGDSRFTRTDLNKLLDLVAISTVADVVPLLDENRSLVKYGLECLNRQERPGIRVLLELLKLGDKTLTSDNIAFIIAPNINALGRMGSASVGVELLTGTDEDMKRLYVLARQMVDNNQARKSIQDDTFRQCREAMENTDCGELFPVIFAPDAHEGVAGIVAGNLKETLYRPVFIITRRSDGQLKGTGRCIPGLNLHEMVSSCSDILTRFGGHAGACGLSLAEENLEIFRDRMQKLMSEKIAECPDVLTEKLLIEKELDSSEKTLEFASMLQKLEPFGADNPKPLFSVSGASVLSVYTMGQENQHMRFTIQGRDGVPVNCVLFRRAVEFSKLIQRGSRIDVAGELVINEYMGNYKLQLTVKDIRRNI